MMAITKQSYKDLKEYWDYQRKVEYNKEIYTIWLISLREEFTMILVWLV